ncbi:MAG: flagellar basal-body rod protein FlgG [Labilithrix sp.]|nr:flagellar basal-body rod protein FlgG [Labilithrix sp.]MBX3216606.1 flagellar basal-body rod protein FlgG [Labilithrix sp.]
MFRSLNVAATGMVAQETKLDTIANNLANANTAGYKRQDAEFEDLLYQNVRAATPNAVGGTAPSGMQVGSGVRVVTTSRAFAQGSIQQTGNPLDIAIEGSGFIGVQRASGEIAYSRAGNLKVDADGRLCTNDGLAIEPPINVPRDAVAVTIASDGTVSAISAGDRSPTQLGQLQLVTFPNPNGLTALGHNLYTATAASGEPVIGAPGTDGRGTILQGALEGSNVEMVSEMIGLIRTQRAYEINSKVISAADDMLRNATQVR